MNTEAKWSYTCKNMTNNAPVKNWMSKTLSLQNFLSDARQLWRISIHFEKKRNLPNYMP